MTDCSLYYVNILGIVVQITVVIAMYSAVRESVRSRKTGQLPIVIPALYDVSVLDGLIAPKRMDLQVKNVGSGPALNVIICLKKGESKITLPRFNVVGTYKGESMVIDKPPLLLNITITELKPFTFRISYFDVYRKKYEMEIDYKTDNSSEVRLISGFEDYKIRG